MSQSLPRTLLLLVSGPAGSGKTTLCERLIATFPDQLRRVITCTTRPPRGTEKDGVDYRFLSKAAFEEKISAGEFIESAVVHQNLYGTRKEDILPLREGRVDLLLNLDVQGAESVREEARHNPVLRRSLVTVFVTPPSFEELHRRLTSRGTDTPDEIRRRLAAAETEMSHWHRYDYCFTSGDHEGDFKRIHAIYLAEKMRVCL
ncbi:MAG: guanylate kinase [Puniceicoccales bacterium]|nr:guanylate kinase [Puniceicoccales bacterium]